MFFSASSFYTPAIESSQFLRILFSFFLVFDRKTAGKTTGKNGRKRPEKRPPLCRGMSNGPQGRAPGPRYSAGYRMGPRAGPLGPRYAVGYRMGPGAGPRAPPGDGHRHRKTVTGKSSPENRHLKTFGTVWGSFWQKLVKSMCFEPNGRHEQFRSAFFIGKSSGISPKALTRVRFVTDRGPWPARHGTAGRGTARNMARHGRHGTGPP